MSTDKAIRLLAKKRGKTVITPWRIVAMVLVVTVIAGFAVALLRPFSFNPMMSLAPLTQTATPSPMPSATSVSPVPPTNTLTPTVSATPSLSPTALPLEVTVAFDSNLRDQPIIGSLIITRLLSGTKVVVLGRDRSLKWVFVQLADKRQGWLALTQISEIVDISSVPFVSATLTATPTKQP